MKSVALQAYKETQIGTISKSVETTKGGIDVRSTAIWISIFLLFIYISIIHFKFTELYSERVHNLGNFAHIVAVAIS